MKVVIIGGGSAGTNCAFFLRKKNKNVKITIVEASGKREYSPCALPYVLSGEIERFEDIFIFSEKDYKRAKIELLLNSNVETVDVKGKKVILDNDKEIYYDKLVFATGSLVSVPKIEGLETVDFYQLKSMEDGERIVEGLKEKGESLVVGGGLIGVELAYSLSKRGEKVTLVEIEKNILSTILDKDMAEKVKDGLKNVNVLTGEKVTQVEKGKAVVGKKKVAFDRLFLCTGTTPNTKLAEDIGIKVGNGISVDKRMESSIKDIYACGDCVESVEFETKKRLSSQLGTVAVRQAKIVASNLVGGDESFQPVLKNTVSKTNLFFGSVGLTVNRAKKFGIKTVWGKYSGNARSDYYPSEERITVKVVCNDKGRVIGGQIAGDCEVVGRLNLLALAIKEKLHVKKLVELEMCYNPASAPIFDPIAMAGEVCLRKLKN